MKEKNTSTSFKIQVLKDAKVLPGDTQEMSGSVKSFLLEWFIKTDTSTTITTNYFIRVSITFKVRKLVSKNIPKI